MKKWTCLLAAFCLLIGLSAPALAAGFQQDTLNGVVVVRQDVVVDGEWLGYGTGTGFFVGKSGENPQYLITNHHVVELFLAAGGGQSGSLLRVIYDQDHVEEAYVVEYNAEADLALLRLGAPTDKRKPLQLSVPTSDLVGSTVYAVGYPAIPDEAVTSVTVYSTEDATVTSGSVSRLLTESGTGRKLLQMDVAIHGGNSGGPLVDGSGAVVGVNTFGIQQDGVDVETLNYALSVEEVIPLLERNGVAYEMAGEGLPIWIIAAIGGGVLLLVVVVVVLLVSRKGKKTPAPAQAPAPNPQMAQPQPAARRPMLRSLSPQHGGMTVPLGSQPVLIGRDMGSCKLVFREGTPGVSARHCSVAWDSASGAFVLTDLKSTYGTFLANGQQVAPGVPCRLGVGDLFYLGDRENTIRVEME